jgi:hypothetical protein
MASADCVSTTTLSQKHRQRKSKNASSRAGKEATLCTTAGTIFVFQRRCRDAGTNLPSSTNNLETYVCGQVNSSERLVISLVLEN